MGVQLKKYDLANTSLLGLVAVHKEDMRQEPEATSASLLRVVAAEA